MEFAANISWQLHVPPELCAAFHDPIVAAAQGYDIVTLVIIIALMVMKPI